MKHQLLTLTLLLTLATPTARACPLCKDALNNSQNATELTDAYSPTNGQAGSGMNRSIYAMLGIFLGTLGLVSTVIVKGIRSSDRHPRA